VRRSARRAAPRDWRGRHLGKRARSRQRVRSRGGGGEWQASRCSDALGPADLSRHGSTRLPCLCARSVCWSQEPGCCKVAPRYFAKMP